MSLMGISDWRAKKQMKYPERGTLRITGTSEHPSAGPTGIRITGVITAPGVPARNVEHETDAGDRLMGAQELPVLIDRADPSRFTILWDEIQPTSWRSPQDPMAQEVAGLNTAAAQGQGGQPSDRPESALGRMLAQSGGLGQMISQAVGDALGEATESSVRRATEEALGPFGGRRLGRVAGRTAGRLLGAAGDVAFGQRGGTYGVPGVPGGQPGYGQPGYDQSGQPSYGQPGQPGQPGYSQPGYDQSGQPGQSAQSGYSQPGQPGAAQPGFGQPGQPGFSQPSFNQPAPPPPAPAGGAPFGGSSGFPQVSWSDQTQAPAPGQAAAGQAAAGQAAAGQAAAGQPAAAGPSFAATQQAQAPGGSDAASAAEFFASGVGEHASAVVTDVRDVPLGAGFAPPGGIAYLTLEITRADGTVYTAPLRLSFATPERRAAVATPGTRLTVRLDPNLPTRVAIVS